MSHKPNKNFIKEVPFTFGLEPAMTYNNKLITNQAQLSTTHYKLFYH